MKITYLLLTFYTVAFCFLDNNFITQAEYAKMLYKNPRGIGCHKCHGKKGEGKIIAFYKSKGVKKALGAPRINNISKKKFIEKFTKRKFKIMPSYYLTHDEIESLYYYLKN